MENQFECDACHRKFNSARSLNSHYRFCKVGTHITKRMKAVKSKYKITESLYRCECGKEFEKYQSLNAHFCWCLTHKHAIGKEEKIADSKIRSGDKCNLSKECCGEDKFNELHKNASKSRKKNIKDGKTTPTWLGRKHKESSKQKQRIGMCNQLNSLPTNKRRANYNPSSIPILESIAKEHGWNIQHAENDGEFYTGIGYFVDAYDKEKNVVLEYDEPAHYVDADNNILRQKDLDRQRRIIEHLHCEYWRYNEKTKTLWKVSL